MKLGPCDLENISSATLERYASRARDFFEGTKDHDVSQNIDVLLKHIPGNPPFSILDFGCGPGRDLGTFSKMGHLAIGLEGCANFARMALDYSGCEVWNQDFLKLDHYYRPANLPFEQQPWLASVWRKIS